MPKITIICISNNALYIITSLFYVTFIIIADAKSILLLELEWI